MTTEQALKEAQTYLDSQNASSEVGTLSDAELISHLPDEVLLQHIQERTPQSPVQDSFHPLASNPLFQSVVTRPNAMYRSAVRGALPGSPETPLQGFRNAATAQGEDLYQRAGSVAPIQQNTIESYYQKLAQLHPGQNPSFGEVLMGNLPSAAGLVGETATNLATGPMDMIAALTPFTRAGQMVGDAVAGSRLGQAAGRMMTEGRSFGSPRLDTVQEVLKVPEARLPKLSNTQRKVYFSERGKIIREQFGAQQQDLKAEQLVLRKELGKAANQRSVYIKEQLPALYSKQSTHYRALVDSELAPVANDLIPDQELRAFLTQRFSKNPERLNAISQKLGLTNEVTPPDALLPPPTLKVGELYQKTLDFGQELPRAVRESLKVYSPADAVTDDAIDALVEFLGTKDVHLKEARTFWKSWAPIRNQATTEFRPFLDPDVRLGMGSARLIRQAKGIDPDNQVYADTLANLLGIDDLPGSVKQVVTKLDTAQKGLAASRLAQAEASGELTALRNRTNLIADRVQRKWFAAHEALKWLLPASIVGGASSIANVLNK